MNNVGYTPDDYDADADLAATGSVICDSCGSRVRTTTLITLPDHGCAAARRRERQVCSLDAGQPAAARNFPKGQ